MFQKAPKTPKAGAPKTPNAGAMENYMRGNSDAQGQQDFDHATAPGQQSQEEAGYQGPDQGPFACGSCTHFDGQGGCELVEGEIDPEGICHLFESAQPAAQAPQPDAEAEADAGRGRVAPKGM